MAQCTCIADAKTRGILKSEQRHPHFVVVPSILEKTVCADVPANAQEHTQAVMRGDDAGAWVIFETQLLHRSAPNNTNPLHLPTLRLYLYIPKLS